MFVVLDCILPPLMRSRSEQQHFQVAARSKTLAARAFLDAPLRASGWHVLVTVSPASPGDAGRRHFSEYIENSIPTNVLLIGKTSFCYKFYLVLFLHLLILIIQSARMNTP